MSNRYHNGRRICDKCGGTHYAASSYDACTLRSTRETPQEEAESKRRAHKFDEELREATRQCQEAAARGEKPDLAAVLRRVQGKGASDPEIVRHRLTFVGPPLARYPKPMGLAPAEWNEHAGRARSVARCFGDACPMRDACWRFVADPTEVSEFFRRSPINPQNGSCMYRVKLDANITEETHHAKIS